MDRASLRHPRQLLLAVTNPALLKKWPLLAVIFLTTLVHVVGSVDLGFQHLALRIPLAVLSLLPLILFILLAQRIGRSSESLRIALVLTAYLAGGALRGTLLETFLQLTGILETDFTTYRIFAGMTIVTSTCVLVSFTWTMTDRAIVAINDLRFETQSLAKALEELRVKSDEADRNEVMRIQERVSSELIRAIDIDSKETQANLERLIHDVVRPLSRDFAREIRGWEPPSIENLKLTFPAFWAYINPIKHLRTPIVGIVALVVSAIASLFALFDVRDAIEVIVGASLSYLVSSYLIFKIFSRWFTEIKPPFRDVLLTLSFISVAIPSVIAQRIALADTKDRDIYVTATLVLTPIFGWMIITGSAAVGLTTELTQRLRDIRDDLRWVIARINLISWYRKGVISRLLHGPVQNSLQVAVLRLRSADENQTNEIVNEVLQRVDDALKEQLDARVSGPLEVKTLETIRETWQSVADISIDVSDSFRDACRTDIAAASIVTDLVQEICSNAIRHGQARRIELVADQSTGSISVEIRDDGHPVTDSDRPTGLGTKFLDSCSIDWGRKSTTSGNLLAIRVPTTHRFRLQD